MNCLKLCVLFVLVSCSTNQEDAKYDKYKFKEDKLNLISTIDTLNLEGFDRFSKKTDLQSKNLMGRVSSVTMSRHDFKVVNGRVVKGNRNYKGHRNNYHSFNINGNLIKSYSINETGKWNLYHYFYGNVNKEIYREEEDTQYLYSIQSYDKFGNNIVSEYHKNDGTLDYAYINNHDKNSNPVEQIAYQDKGQFWTEFSAKYDLNNNKVFHEYGNKHSWEEVKFEYLYDDSNSIINSKRFVRINKQDDYIMDLVTDNLYGENGNLVQKEKFYYKGKHSDWEMKKYDDYGNLIEHFKKKGDNIENVIDYVFRRKYEYKYDEFGNWIKEVMYDLDAEELWIASQLIEREIVYY